MTNEAAEMITVKEDKISSKAILGIAIGVTVFCVGSALLTLDNPGSFIAYYLMMIMSCTSLFAAYANRRKEEKAQQIDS